MPNEFKDKIAVLGESSFAIGFKLAGISDVFLTYTNEEFQNKLNELLNRREYGIIIVTDKALESVDWKTKKKLEEVAKPVVIAVPGKEGPIGQAENLNRLIKRALGFELMAKK